MHLAVGRLRYFDEPVNLVRGYVDAVVEKFMFDGLCLYVDKTEHLPQVIVQVSGQPFSLPGRRQCPLLFQQLELVGPLLGDVLKSNRGSVMLALLVRQG